MNPTTMFSKILSTGWMASEVTILTWIYGYIMDVGVVGAITGFLYHTCLLYLIFAALTLLKKWAETHAWPMWAVKTLRAAYVVSYGYDVWFNTRYGTLLFVELPPVRETKVMGIPIRHRFEPLTRRLQRHYLIDGWRGNEARMFCWLIHKVDNGHCLK